MHRLGCRYHPDLMIYYRTNASRQERMPPELIGWQAFAPYSLIETITDGYRYAAIGKPEILGGVIWNTPPTTGWQDIGLGWECARTQQDWEPLAHVRASATWPCYELNTGGHKWFLPAVLGQSGARAFKTKIGPGWKPLLTAEQEEAERRAKAVREAIESKQMPAMEIQAESAAFFLSLAYFLSPATIAACGLLDEEMVGKVLSVAAGVFDSNGT